MMTKTYAALTKCGNKDWRGQIEGEPSYKSRSLCNSNWTRKVSIKKMKTRQKDFFPFSKPSDTMKNADTTFQRHVSELHFKV